MNNEKKTYEEALQLVTVAQHSKELINISTFDGKMVFLNLTGSKILGIEPDEVEKINIMQVIPDHLKPIVENELLPALKNGGVWEGELQYINLKTGRLTDVQAQTFTINDQNTGKPLFLANVSLDLTERKKAEKELKEQLHELEIFQKATEGRELKMMDLEKEVNQLLVELGREKKYPDRENA